MYDWANDPGALAPGTDVSDVLSEVDMLCSVVDRLTDFIVSRGLADDYRAWRRAR